VSLRFAGSNWDRKVIALDLNIDFSVSSFKYFQITAFHLQLQVFTEKGFSVVQYYAGNPTES
jgi:hypothetical protein